MNLRQQAAKGIVWSAIQKLGNQAVSLVVFFCLARLLAPEAFGLIALASVFLAFVQIFLNQGFAEAIVQREELEPEHLDTAFWVSLVISIVLTIISISIAGIVAQGFQQPELAPIIRWLSLGFLLSAFNSVQQAIFRRDLAFKPLAIRSLVASFFGGIVGVAMAFLGCGVWSLVGQQLTNNIVGILVLWWASDWKPGFKVSQKHFHELFHFGINILGFNLLNFFNRRSDDFLIGYFLGATALGYYTIAYRLLLLMTNLLTNTMAQVALPTFSRLQSQPEKMRRAFYTATQLSSLVAFPAFLGMAILAPELVPMVFGENWLPSIPVMQILSIIGILHAIEYFNQSVILAMGKPSWRFKINAVNAVGNVIGFLVVVHWGILAVAAAYVIRGYLFLPLPLWAIHKLIKIDFKTYASQFVAPFTSAIVMVSLITGIKIYGGDLLNLPLLITICTGTGILTYSLMIRWLAPQLFQQVLTLVASLIPHRKTRQT
ncbi:MAG: lipopolysaccharide biosynthesis protein [Microcoleaceae cyanobacterium]